MSPIEVPGLGSAHLDPILEVTGSRGMERK
jgi:hypothetical protein